MSLTLRTCLKVEKTVISSTKSLRSLLSLIPLSCIMTHHLIPIHSKLRLHPSDASLPIHQKEEALRSTHHKRLKTMLTCNSTMAVSITKKKSGIPAPQASTRARASFRQVVLQADSQKGILLNGNTNILFQVNPLSLRKMERRSKHRKMKAMIRS